MKRLGVFMLPPGWDASPSQGYPQHYAGTHLYTWVESSTVRVKCLAQEHNTMSPARPRTRTIRSGVEHTNHKATAPLSKVKYDTPDAVAVATGSAAGSIWRRIDLVVYCRNKTCSLSISLYRDVKHYGQHMRFRSDNLLVLSYLFKIQDIWLIAERD